MAKESKGNPPTRVPKDVAKVLRVIAAEKGTSIGEIIRQMVEQIPEYQETKDYLDSKQEKADWQAVKDLMVA